MGLEIVVTSENKGSNPGGRCIVKSSIEIFPKSYIKYCNRGQGLNGFNLLAQNQPIYEAMSLEMVKMLGLNIPNYFVILNYGGDNISFKYEPEKEKHIKKLSDNKKFYFVSRLIKHPIDETNPKLIEIMASEKIYRDLLHIGNVSGRPENYTLINIPGMDPFVLYIDLGCGLVDAYEGLLTIRSSLIKKVLNLKNRKTLKDLKKKLERIDLKTDFGAMVNLVEFGEYILKCCKINTLDASDPKRIKSVAVESILSQGELVDLSNLYFAANIKFLDTYKGDSRLFRTKR